MIVALCREHQLAVPVAEGSVGDAHHVEQGQPDSWEPLIVGQHFEVGLAKDNGRSGQLVDGQRPLACGLAQHPVQVTGEGSAQIDRRIDSRRHNSPQSWY